MIKSNLKSKNTYEFEKYYEYDAVTIGVVVNLTWCVRLKNWECLHTTSARLCTWILIAMKQIKRQAKILN